MDEPIYKILTAAEWSQAERDGRFEGSAVDRADGYIHFSTATHVRETAARHFAGQAGLLLLSVDPARLPRDALRWEPSRRGALFPHLYAPLPLASVTRVEPLPLGPEGHRFPDSVPG
jgi:uncharacterized protein (DUF952 family)